MKKICILVYDDSLTGGAETVAKNLAAKFSGFYNVFLVSVFQSKKKENEKIGYNHYIIEKEMKSLTLNLLSISKKLKKYLLENNIDILLSITAGVNSIAILATENTNIKTIYCEHSNLENRSYGYKHILRQKLGARYMNKIVTLTERDRNNFVKLFKTPEKKVVCIPNWYTKCENNFQYNRNSKKIISVGRLEKVKGYNFLIKVAKIIKNEYPDWQWDIYGDGSLRNVLEDQIEKNDLNNFIVLKGNVKNLNELYKDYSFCVMTSYYEGIPLSLLEAKNAKLPIVSFDCPTGPAEIVDNGKDGFLIECYDCDIMAKKIKQLIEDSSLRMKFSNNSTKKLDKFDEKKILRNWKELIENI